MIKVSITNIKGQNFDAYFNTEQEAETWVESQIQKNSWGLQDRWIKFPLQNPLDGYTNTRTVEGDLEYFYPCEYTITYSDISSQINALKESQDALKFLQETDYKIIRHNGQLALGVQTTLTHAQYIQLEQQRQAARAKVL